MYCLIKSNAVPVLSKSGIYSALPNSEVGLFPSPHWLTMLQPHCVLTVLEMQALSLWLLLLALAVPSTWNKLYLILHRQLPLQLLGLSSCIISEASFWLLVWSTPLSLIIGYHSILFISTYHKLQLSCLLVDFLICHPWNNARSTR